MEIDELIQVRLRLYIYNYVVNNCLIGFYSSVFDYFVNPALLFYYVVKEEIKNDTNNTTAF